MAFAPGSVCVEVASRRLGVQEVSLLLCSVLFVEVLVIGSKYDKDRDAFVKHRQYIEKWWLRGVEKWSEMSSCSYEGGPVT